MNSNPVLSKTHTPTHSAILPGWFLSTPSFLSKLVFSHPLKRSRLVLHQLITLMVPSGMPSCSQLGSNPVVFGELPEYSKAQCSLNKPESTTPSYWTLAECRALWLSHGVGRRREWIKKETFPTISTKFWYFFLGLSRPCGGWVTYYLVISCIFFYVTLQLFHM